MKTIHVVAFISLFVVVFWWIPCCGAPPDTGLEVTFDTCPEGPYRDQAVREDWPGLEWASLHERGRIVTPEGWSGRRCLQISYPKGTYGPSKNGGQFKVKLPAREEYWCDYCLMFRDGLDFRRGGKLPGLCGGDCNTGGRKPSGDGWSARYMWREGGTLELYLYHLDQPDKWGEGLRCDGMTFETGRWYRLTQYIRVNAPNARDGIVRVWVDGRQVLDRRDIRFRNIDGALIDRFYFSTFHGGGNSDWAPDRDSYICFDSFRILPAGDPAVADLLSTDPAGKTVEPKP